MLDTTQDEQRVRSYVSRRTQLGRPQYQGPTYYRQPAIKASSWTRKVPAYVFVSGLAGAAQIIAALARFGGGARRRSIVRNGRMIALGGSLLGAPILIFDLKTPSRFMNMLRIFRITSPLSFGSFILTGFGAFSAAAAAGEAASRRTRIGRTLQTAGDLAQIPAALAGAGMATYTGAVLAATSNPLWAAAPGLVSARFGTSAMASGAAALSLAEQMSGDRNANSRTLDNIAMISTAATLMLSLAADETYKRENVAAPLQEGLPGLTHKYGSLALGQILPLALHGTNAVRQERSPRLSIAANIAVLAGSAIMRQAFMRAEKTSAKRPEDYFSFTQFDRVPNETHAQEALPERLRAPVQRSRMPEGVA